MNNAQIAQVFEDMAALLEMKGELVFKVRAYRRAAEAIRQLPVAVEQLVSEARDLKEIPGVGDAISRKIIELLATGKVRAYEELKAERARRVAPAG